MDQKEKDKKYNKWAREIPTYICISFPFLIFLIVLFKMDNKDQDAIQWFITKVVMWGAAIFPALFFLLRMLIRDFASFIADNLLFQWWGNIYIWPRYMYRIFLVDNSGISANSMNKIKDALRRSGLSTETSDKKEKKRTIKDMISYIKNSTRDDSIVFEYNIFYGFYRNMVGGLLLVNIMFYIFPFSSISIFKSLDAEINIIKIIIWILFGMCLIFMYYNDYKYALKMLRLYLKKI